MRTRLPLTLLIVCTFFGLTSSLRGQGLAIGGAGPVNRAMAGAATAAPIDAAGAIHWNVASMSGLQQSEMLFGLELLLPTEEVSSSVAGIFAGATCGEPGVVPIPTMALVHKCEDSPWTWGLGMFGIAGFQVNYPSSTLPGNPILSPPPPNGVGLGRIHTEAQYLQIVPAVSLAITDKLSVGFGPTVTLAKLVVDPLFFAAPNADGLYPDGSGSRYSWGAGFQAGVYYITDSCWHYGFSFTSPQWFEPIRAFTTDADGFPRVATANFDYPMILSLGLAYSGWENWLFAFDARYFDYRNADGFGDPAGYDPATGAVTGLGWRSTFSFHTGVQYQATERLYLRGGYQYCDSPIVSETAFFNIAAPLIEQHTVSAGVSYHLTCNLIFSAAYLHAFEANASGPVQLPTGPVPGYSVTNKISADALVVGFTLRY